MTKRTNGLGPKLAYAVTVVLSFGLIPRPASTQVFPLPSMNTTLSPEQRADPSIPQMTITVTVPLEAGALSTDPAGPTPDPAGPTPRSPVPLLPLQLLTIDGAHVERVRDSLRRGEPQFQRALAELEAEANRALKIAPMSVMDKSDHAAERRQARLHEPGAVLVARPRQAGWPSVHPQGRRAESGDQPDHRSRQSRTPDRRRRDARPRLSAHRPRRIRGARGAPDCASGSSIRRRA